MAAVFNVAHRTLAFPALLGLALFMPILASHAPAAAQSSDAPQWWKALAGDAQCRDASASEKVCESVSLSPETAYRQSGWFLISPIDAASVGPLAPGSGEPTQLNLRFKARSSSELSFSGSGYSTAQLEGFGSPAPTTGAGTGTMNSNCTAAQPIVADALTRAGVAYRSISNLSCQWNLYTRPDLTVSMKIVFSLEQGATKPAPSNCTTDLLSGAWRAENAALAKTGHSISFGPAPNLPKHDDGQNPQQGKFSVFAAQKPKLALLPNPYFTSTRGWDVGANQCLIPMISQQDAGTSRSAALIDTANDSLRFVSSGGYRFDKGKMILGNVAAFPVQNLEGRWVRGAAPAEVAACKPGDINGGWARSDGARITIRGTGTDGIGGTASMDENPGNWVQGQPKYTVIRSKGSVASGNQCAFTARCFASQRIVTNGQPDFRMNERACELVFDMAKQTLFERGTDNSYVYNRANAAAKAATKTTAPPKQTAAPSASTPSAETNALYQQQNAAILAKQKADKDAADAYAREKKRVEEANLKAQQLYAKQQAEYKAAVAAREAETARINAANAAAQAKYQKDLADYEACKKGDKARCK
jgi:hypothetical protein